ncbi:hypothetical protein MTO96_009638 [Rhipicephalus appendiculatus]
MVRELSRQGRTGYGEENYRVFFASFVGRLPPQHLLLVCPTHDQQRRPLLLAYRSLGLPTSTQDDLLFPATWQEPAFKSLLDYLESTGLSSRL